MRTITTVVMFAVLLIAPAANAGWPAISQWDAYYRATVLPDASGAVTSYTGHTTNFTSWLGEYYGESEIITDPVLGEAVYHMSSVDFDGAAAWYIDCHNANMPRDFTSAAGYTVEMKAKLNSTDSEGKGAAVLFLNEAGQNRFWGISLETKSGGAQYVGLQGYGTPLEVPITPGWHTYRMVAKSDGVRLYMDGSPLVILHLLAYRTDVGGATWGFGDTTGAQDGDWALDYVGITASVAEPTLDWDIYYEGKFLPTGTGVLMASSGDTTNFSPYAGSVLTSEVIYDADLGHNVYRMNTINSNAGGAWWTLADMGDRNGDGIFPPVYNSTTGYTVELKAKLNNTDEEGTGACALVMNEKNQNRFWVFSLQKKTDGKQYVGLQGGSGGYFQEIAAGWHTYRMTAKVDGVRLYIDDRPMPALYVPTYRTDIAGGSWYFGDGSGTQDGDWCIDYLGIKAGLLEPTAWDFYYDAQYYPTTWYSVSTPTGDYTSFSQYFGGPDAFTSMVYDSELKHNVVDMNTIETPDYNINACEWYSSCTVGDRSSPPDYIAPRVWSATTGYTYEAKIKLIDTDSAGDGAVSFGITDSSTSNRMWLSLQVDAGQQYVALKGGGAGVRTPITPGWHTYRVVVKSSGARLFIDDSATAALEITTFYNGSFGFLEFGDATGAQDGHFRLDHIAVYAGVLVPGPADCAEAIALGYKIAGDVNGDCYVNFKDIGEFAAEWLECGVVGNPSCQ